MSDHGTRRRYADGCRCHKCRLTIVLYGRDRLARAQQARLNGPRREARHGTFNEYNNHACRCDACKQAARNKNAEDYRRRSGER